MGMKLDTDKEIPILESIKTYALQYIKLLEHSL